MSVTFCTVCKFEQFFDEQKASGRKKRWSFTSERTSVSQVQVIFKLFEILKQEFLAGSVCDECFSLLDQIDSLEFQVSAMTKALKSRIDLASKLDEGDEDLDESISVRQHTKRRRQRNSKPTFTSLRGMNESVDEGDDWNSDIGNDETTDSTFKPSFRMATSSTKQVSKRKYPREKPRHKRAKNALPYNAESKRQRHEHVDENSVDNDPIDVNKFLANDEIRIKEEENFEDSFADYVQSGNGDANMSVVAKRFWDMVSDPRVIDKVLDTENVDYNVTMAQTTRGQEQLVYEGYTYKKYSYQEKQERVIKWKCSNYYAKKGKCPAKIATTPDGLCVLIDSKMDHNHEPDQSAIKIIMFRDRVKEMAVNHPDMKASEILANVEMLMDNPGPLGLKDESLMRYVQRVRSKQARGEMGFKKVTYHRKKATYRWGMNASGSDEMTPEKKVADGRDFVPGNEFQQNFMENMRDETDQESRHSPEMKRSQMENEHFPDLNDSNLRPESLVHSQSVSNSSFNISNS